MISFSSPIGIFRLEYCNNKNERNMKQTFQEVEIRKPNEIKKK